MLREQPGVVAVEYDGRTQALSLRYDAATANIAELEALVRRAGGTLHIAESKGGEALAPAEGELAQLPLMLRLTIACLVALVAGWVAEDFFGLPHNLALVFYLTAYVTGGYFSVQEAWETLKERQFDVNFLMIIAAVGAGLIGYAREGAVLMFLFSLAETLETYAMGRTHNAVRALLDTAPQEATVERDGQRMRVAVEQLVIGDTMIIKPGEQVAADGEIISGESAVNEATITGESVPADKRQGDQVFAGTLNGQGALRVRVTTPVADSMLSRIVRYVEEAQARKAQSQDFTDRVIGQYYAYAVVVITLLAIIIPLVFLGWDTQTTLYRAMTLMVVASPCALVISIPAAVLSALAHSARNGALFKGGSHLEAGSKVQVVAFDKTGTLTTGKVRVVRVVPFGNHEHDAILHMAAAVEHMSEHPLAQAITHYAEEHGVAIADVHDFKALTGVGAQATLNGSRILVGRPDRFDLDEATRATVEELEDAFNTVVIVSRDGVVCGTIALADTIRPGVADVIARLKSRGFAVAMLTGDNVRVARALGRTLGIEDVRAGLLPEDKVTVVDDLRERYGAVAMVGDGVNDAPALASADLGIAMGAAGTDTAIESADVLLMSDDIARVPATLEMAQRARGVIRQNMVFAFAVMLVAVVLAVTGLIPLSIGVVVHEGSTLLVVANGLRLLAQQ